ncbi:hypothetical protein FRX31_002725 [Thalictrum thalictroides]|uniref:Uncharacterized protein n=1 Tax=Thalictrum thalictroides TaxID=46969 RepID=A0A7J6XDQ1_THATH|nr:hypothetical protein FRX31_002725 [Thalictrum thalictroides]
MFSRLCRCFGGISKIRHYRSGILNQQSYKEPTKMDIPFSPFVGVKQITAINRFSTVSEAQQDFPLHK